MSKLSLPKVYELILTHQANAIMDCLTDVEKEESWHGLEIDGIDFDINFYTTEHQIGKESCKFLCADVYLVENGETQTDNFLVLIVRPI
jgi:hypothetical protein